MAMDKTCKSRYYEGCGKEGPILCIFICEFHSTYGPKISCQVPKGFITKETFESVNVYLIPKPQLIRSIITVTLDDIKMVGYPVRIESQVYPRNAFYYNLCFICDSWARTVQYDQVVKDFSNYLRQLEEDCRLLSKMEETEARVSAILEQVLSDLNTTTISSLQEGKRSVRLKVGRLTKVDVPSHSVPFLVGTGDLTTSQHWDQNSLSTLNKVVQHVDGLNHVEKISTLANVELTQVKICLRNLINDSLVKLMSQYNETNCYLVTRGVRKLFLDKQLQVDCLNTVACNQGNGGQPTVRDVMRVYCSFNQGATVKDICLRFDLHQLKIDCKKLVQYGLLQGFVRRLNKHVIKVNENGESCNIKEEHEPVFEKFDGKRSLEEICCDTGYTLAQLDQLVQSHHCLLSIYK